MSALESSDVVRCNHNHVGLEWVPSTLKHEDCMIGAEVRSGLVTKIIQTKPIITTYQQFFNNSLFECGYCPLVSFT